MDMQKQTMRYLKGQCARYPALETQDLLKALHQSVYGCGHFVSDAAADLLEQELASLRPDASAQQRPLLRHTAADVYPLGSGAGRF